jgi:hypothetical protein
MAFDVGGAARRADLADAVARDVGVRRSGRERIASGTGNGEDGYERRRGEGKRDVTSLARRVHARNYGMRLALFRFDDDRRSRLRVHVPFWPPT